MSRAWIAFYMGDYDKDTKSLTTLEHGAYFLLLQECWVHGSIPLESAKRASIAKMSLRDWNKIAPTINAFFNDDGSQTRASAEIEKAEKVYTQRQLAGRRGGLRSGMARSIKKGNSIKLEAKTKQTFSTIGSGEPSTAEPTHISKTITSSVDAPREGLAIVSSELVELNKRKFS
jgi:uncharacterized protein YdaU (DUF1376 family)